MSDPRPVPAATDPKCRCGYNCDAVEIVYEEDVVTAPGPVDGEKRWIKQTILAADLDWYAKGITPGNCQQAALASLLGVPLVAVPHFAAAPPEEGVPEGWSLFRDVRLWLREHHNIDYCWTADEHVYEQLRAAAPEWSEPYGIALGRTRRGPALHSVVWNLATWEIAHDPHPDDSGLVELLQVEWLTPPYDPEPHEQIRLWLEAAVDKEAGRG